MNADLLRALICAQTGLVEARRIAVDVCLRARIGEVNMEVSRLIDAAIKDRLWPDVSEVCPMMDGEVQS